MAHPTSGAIENGGQPCLIYLYAISLVGQMRCHGVRPVQRGQGAHLRCSGLAAATKGKAVFQRRKAPLSSMKARLSLRSHLERRHLSPDTGPEVELYECVFLGLRWTPQCSHGKNKRNKTNGTNETNDRNSDKSSHKNSDKSDSNKNSKKHAPWTHFGTQRSRTTTARTPRDTHGSKTDTSKQTKNHPQCG